MDHTKDMPTTATSSSMPATTSAVMDMGGMDMGGDCKISVRLLYSHP